jgi:hypothetical protein
VAIAIRESDRRPRGLFPGGAPGSSSERAILNGIFNAASQGLINHPLTRITNARINSFTAQLIVSDIRDIGGN